MGDIPEPLLDAVASFSSLRGRWTELSSIERVLACTRHKEPDRVPVTPILVRRRQADQGDLLSGVRNECGEGG